MIETSLANLSKCIRKIKEEIRRGKRSLSDPVTIQLTDYQATLEIKFRGILSYGKGDDRIRLSIVDEPRKKRVKLN